MQIVVGTVTRVIEREAHSANGNTWTEHTLAVADFGRTDYVKVGRDMDRAGVPAVGAHVLIEVMSAPWKTREGEPRVQLVGLRQVTADDLDAAMSGVAPEPRLSAV